MTSVNKPLPDFEQPPVVEVALSVQFETLPNFRTPQVGLLWQDFRDRFPKTEDHPPLDPVFEQFGVPPSREISFHIRTAPPVPRCWFFNADGTELVQVQQDRFIHNWRKAGGEGIYPRYERVRATFERELHRFSEFLIEQEIGELTPNQCEVTYVNQIPPGRNWSQHGHLGEVLTLFTPRYADEFRPDVEGALLWVKYVITDQVGKPIGRLHLNVQPAFRTTDEAPMFELTLTARGRPLADGIPGVLDFLDIGRERVVRTFASVTTPEMHEAWRRRR